MTQKTKIMQVIAPTIEDMGLVLWGCDLSQAGHHSVLRVYVDGPNNTGVSIDACAKVSREIGALLDVEDPIKNRYQLEVSSPGVERPLFTPAQFAYYIGREVKIKLRVAQAGRRQFVSHVLNVVDEKITLGVDQEEITVTMNDIQKANLMMKVGS